MTDQEVEAIFDTFYKACSIVHRADEISKKRKQIEGCLRKECGNCDDWMKSSCIPEKRFGRFKSMGTRACGDFVLAHSSKFSIKKFQKELAAMLEEKP